MRIFRWQKFQALVGMMTLLISTSSFADSGFYSDSYGKVAKIITKVTQTQNGGFMHQSGGGYDFSQYFAIEGSYTQYPDVPLVAGNVKTGNMIHVAAKGIVPLNDNFKIYGKAGAARVTNGFLNGLDYNAMADLNDATILPYLGTGIGYSVSENVEFNLQFAETPKSDQIPMMYSTLTDLSFKF